MLCKKKACDECKCKPRIFISQNAWLLKLQQRETHLFSACAKSRAGFINSSVRHGWSMKNGWPSKGCSYTHTHTYTHCVQFFVNIYSDLIFYKEQVLTVTRCNTDIKPVPQHVFFHLNSMLTSHTILFITQIQLRSKLRIN